MPTSERGRSLSRFTSDAAVALGGPTWLSRRRADAWERFSARPMPSESEEIWRYSGIDDFDLDRYAPLPPAASGEDPPAVAPLAVAPLAVARELADVVGRRAALVVTVDGAVRHVEAATTGIAVGGVADRSEPVDALGGVVGADDAFGELHDAFTVDAAVVDVPAGHRGDAPVVVVHLVRGRSVEGRGGAAFPHTTVRVGRGAGAGLVEIVASLPGDGADGAAGALVVPVTEIDVADGARLAYASLQVLDGRATQVAVQGSRVGRDAELQSMAVASGGAFARLRTDAALVGAGGTSALLAAFLATGDQVLDFRTTQEHAAPHSTSELLFKGAVADRSRSVYSGLIQIRRGARGTSALQTNHNLVLSEGARADSVPNLDIEENDVRCSHASTVGPIDEEQRYYLESRGIEPEVAERLVVAGFFASLAGRSPFPGVAAWIERTFEARLAGRDQLATVGGGGGA